MASDHETPPISLTVGESLIFAQRTAYLDGLAEGVRIAVAHMKQKLVEDVAAGKPSPPPAQPVSRETTPVKDPDLTEE